MLLGLQPFSDDACGNDALIRVDVPVGGADERPECPELSRRPLVRRHNEKHSLDLPQWEAPYSKYKVRGLIAIKFRCLIDGRLAVELVEWAWRYCGKSQRS
jgi:hypothetical protein